MLLPHKKLAYKLPFYKKSFMFKRNICTCTTTEGKQSNRNLIHGEELQGTSHCLNSPLCSVHACVPSWYWRQRSLHIRPLARRQHLLTLTFPWWKGRRISKILHKDQYFSSSPDPFQRPHSWYFGLGFCPCMGVASFSLSQLIGYFLSSAEKHPTVWIHFGLFNRSLTYRCIYGI